MPILPKSTTHTATVPVTITPSGMACKLEVWLTPDAGKTKSATSGLISFTSTAASQSISVSVTVPATAGAYQVYIDVYADSTLIGAYVATSLANIPSVTITEPSWV